MSSFQQILGWGMAHRNTLLFALVWLIITAVAAISVTSMVGKAVLPISRKATRRRTGLIFMWRRTKAPGIVALALLTLFLAAYICIVLVWEDFAYYDNSILTLSTLKGYNIQPPIWPEAGRFFPLGLQEFNLIRHFTNTDIGYHSLTILQLLIFSYIILALDDELSITTRSVLLVVALSTPSILLSFTELIFVERNIVFFLVCLVFSIKRFERTQSAAWAVAAVICAQIMIYTKETAFLLVLGFAVSRLTLRYRLQHGAATSYRLWNRENRLDLCLTCLAVLFLIVYFGFIGNGNMKYAVSARKTFADITIGYTRVDLLPWVMLVVLLCRMYFVLRHRAAPLILWDGLAFGGLACFLAYLYLRIFGIYYLAPVDLIAVLYVGRLAALSWKELRLSVQIAAMCLAFIVLFQNSLVSAFSVYERKNVIHANAELASVVQTQYRLNTGNDLRLFFPFAGGEEIMEFGAYLSYRGLPVDGAADEGSSRNKVLLAWPAKDSPCVEWNKIWCQEINEPTPGDLVIVLPDDGASLAEASVYREGKELIISYEPRPRIPHWLFEIFDNLHIDSESRYRYEAFPDRWMDASVTMWK